MPVFGEKDEKAETFWHFSLLSNIPASLLL
jgi:hypothetical protein